MSAHADVLDRTDPLTKPFWVSFTLHVLVLGGLTVGAVINPHLNIGSPTGGGMGAFMVNPVATIPLPNRGGRENPVANDTKSQVPTPPAPKEKAKPVPKVKVPEPDAVPLKSAKAPVKHQREYQPQPQPNKFRDQETYNPSQLYSDVGQRASSQMYQMPGGGGVGLGDNSPFGEQFGAYANTVRNIIAQNWKPMKASGSPAVVVTFTIQRNGSITNVKVSQTSGIPSMDFSAQRAVLDATLPALPPNFPRSQADVDLKFVLGN
jgi:protein TonB